MAAIGADETDVEESQSDEDESSESQSEHVPENAVSEMTVENTQNQTQEIQESLSNQQGPKALKVYSKTTLDVFEGNDLITVPWPSNLPLYADEVHIRWVKGIWRFKVGSGTTWGKGKPDFQIKWNGEFSFSDENSDVIVEVLNTRE